MINKIKIWFYKQALNSLPKYCKCGLKLDFYPNGVADPETGKQQKQWKCSESTESDIWTLVHHDRYGKILKNEKLYKQLLQKEQK